MKQFRNIHDVTDVKKLVANGLSIAQSQGKSEIGKGKTLGLIFLNSSLRTKMSSQKAAQNLGMQCLLVEATSGWPLEFEDGVVMNIDRPEHIKEASAVLSQYCDILGLRAFPSLTDREKDYSDFVFNQFEQYATVPVVSFESAIYHPLQGLADMITIEQHKKKERPKVVLSWAPHIKALPQAVSNSFVNWSSAMDYDLVITNPEGYDLNPSIRKDIPVIHDQAEAFKDADFVYVKNWSSYEQYGQVLTKDPSWMITGDKIDLTNDAKVMHCLPVRRNVVIADEVMDSANALMIPQAGNREYSCQAVLEAMLKHI